MLRLVGFFLTVIGVIFALAMFAVVLTPAVWVFFALHDQPLLIRGATAVIALILMTLLLEGFTGLLESRKSPPPVDE